MTNRKTPRKYFLMYFAFALSVSLMQCSKTAVDPIGLPPETQTGAGIFACKINGVVWQYKNPNYEVLSTKPKTRWEFDPTLWGGNLYIGGVRYLDGVKENDLLSLGADSLLYNNEKTIFGLKREFGIRFTNYTPNSNECGDIGTSPLGDTTNFYSSGKLIISKLDQNTKIIAGTFYCTIKQTGCDTLKITEGRFDIKYQ